MPAGEANTGWLEIVGATENNLQNVHAAFPLGCLTCVTGVIRQRQEHPGGRHPTPRVGPPALPCQGRSGQTRTHRGRGADRPRHRHRPDRPIGPQPTLQPGDVHRRVRADPGPVRATPRRPHPRVRRGAVFIQRARRTLRTLRGRRRDEDRDAVHARRTRHLRGLRGQTLQPRDAGGHLQRQEHRRRARPDRGGSQPLLPRRARAGGPS